jgi:hypothetical protein
MTKTYHTIQTLIAKEAEVVNTPSSRLEDRYEEFKQQLAQNFFNLTATTKNLFTTDATGLWDAYINAMPQEARSHYQCNECRHFIERVGGLVYLNDKGAVKSAIWSDKNVPAFFRDSVKTLNQMVTKANVTGVFASDEATLGTPRTGEWTHNHVVLPKDMVNSSYLKSAYQVSAEKLEDFKMLNRALKEFGLNTVTQALNILKADAFYRSEKVLGVAEWFNELHTKVNAVRYRKNKENIVWLAVATAPTGFCHIRSSMIGTLLEDIANGLDFNSVKSRFEDKMKPTKYQRPQALPTAGNKAQAERIVAKMGIENSFKRRFARLEELNLTWTPKQQKPANNGITTGVFGHVQTKGVTFPQSAYVPEVTMTWERFSREVLPFAEEIEYAISGGYDSFSAIVTADDMTAPPIIQWDNEEQRNPFSWYLYSSGSRASDFNLTSGYTKVTGITYQPSMWYDENPHQGKGVFFILDGARDMRYLGAGSALFPEILKSELREVRSTIEEFSRTGTIQGADESSACGIRLQANDKLWTAKLRVKSATGTTIYKLDRWN